MRGEEEGEDELGEREPEVEALATTRGEERPSPPPLPPLPPLPAEGEGDEATQTATSARRGGDQAVFFSRGSGEE